jgi:hypothetical protein
MKGSPVRVRASALRKPRKSGLSFWVDGCEGKHRVPRAGDPVVSTIYTARFPTIPPRATSQPSSRRLATREQHEYSPVGSSSLWVSSALARWPKTHVARGCRIGLVQRSALLPGRCLLQALVLGCAVSDWYVPLTVSGTGAVRSRSDGSGPLGARFAAAFWSF